MTRRLSWLHHDTHVLTSKARGRTINHTAGELTTGGVDVIAARTADSCKDAPTHELVTEGLNHLRRGTSIQRAGEGVEGN